eukprot:scaffold7653_cov120-Isochrysis_galbana.AAC.8
MADSTLDEMTTQRQPNKQAPPNTQNVIHVISHRHVKPGSREGRSGLRMHRLTDGALRATRRPSLRATERQGSSKAWRPCSKSNGFRVLGLEF